MNKLKLDLEHLTVESFETTRTSGKATVLGHEATAYRENTCASYCFCDSADSCPSYDLPCNPSEGYSCAGNCLQSFQSDCLTCNGTCETCRGTSCLQPSECLGCTQNCTSPGDCDA